MVMEMYHHLPLDTFSINHKFLRDTKAAIVIKVFAILFSNKHSKKLLQ